MMYRVIFLFLVLRLPCAAQHPDKHYRDSLATLITAPATPDSIKARAGFLLSDEWSYTDTTQSKQYLETGKKYSGKNNYLLGLYNFYAGQYYYDTDPARAKEFYLKCVALLDPYTHTEAWYFKARAWRNYGSLLQKADDEKSFLTILTEKVIPATVKSGDKLMLSRNYADVGLIFSNQWQYDKAETYYDKAIGILNEMPQPPLTEANTYIDATSNLLYEDKLDKALHLINTSRPLLTPGSLPEIEFYKNQGIYYRKTRKYPQSLAALDTALAAAKKTTWAYRTESVMFLKFKTLKEMGQLKPAKEVLLQIVEAPTSLFNQNRLMHYYELAEIFARLGDMASAYKWQKAYGTLLDSLSNVRLKDQINELESKFRYAENKREIAELGLINEKAQSAVKSSRLMNWLLVSASIFLLVVATFGWLFYRNNRKLSQQLKLNHIQELKDVNLQQQIKIAQAMLQGQEEERNRVARDLHDGLGSMLAGVKLNLSHIASDKERESDPRLMNTMRQLDSSVGELRRIAHNMMPSILLRYGLEASLKELCESLMSPSLVIDLQCLNIHPQLPMEEQLSIYRIVQELLSNVVKHAAARNVMLQCSQDNKIFLITIEDDGKGFDFKQTDPQKGIGITNIRNRVAYLNGTLEFKQRDNGPGTVIDIELHVTV